MAEKISDLSGNEREQRIAELKRKMQESAKRNRAANGEESPEPPATVSATGTEAQSAADDSEDGSEGHVEVMTTAAAAVVIDEPIARSDMPSTTKPVTAKPSVNGSTPKAATEPEGPSNTEMNRREFLTYAWGGALGLLALEGGVLSFQFMYPRFKEGEFGGKFFIGPVTAMPDQAADPQAHPDGKFWLITTAEDAPKALYMVCTHLGCLYKWEESNSRFECPCHGSKFTHDGYYIEGPAPRSLDYFETVTVEGAVVVDTGNRILGAPASESPANASAA
jgi:cytochrome b6-f complex iron-sulfur subunit